jgi:hypothetical protein
MDKKRIKKILPPEDLKGFEDFIEGQSGDTNFLPRPNKKETSFEHFTFLSNDAERLLCLKELLMEKLPFTSKYDQSDSLIQAQKNELAQVKKTLFDLCQKPDSAYMRSLEEVFDSFFGPPPV